jgi:hypothetical protein
MIPGFRVIPTFVAKQVMSRKLTGQMKKIPRHHSAFATVRAVWSGSPRAERGHKTTGRRVVLRLRNPENQLLISEVVPGAWQVQVCTRLPLLSLPVGSM